MARAKNAYTLPIIAPSVSRYAKNPTASPKRMNALTSPLLNGSANSEVIIPHTVKNRISEIITWILPARTVMRTALTTSYKTASTAPNTSDHRK